MAAPDAAPVDRVGGGVSQPGGILYRVGGNVLLAALISLHAAGPAPAADRPCTRSSCPGNQSIWSEDHTADAGDAGSSFTATPAGCSSASRKPTRARHSFRAGRSPAAAACGPATSSSSGGPAPDRRPRPAAPRGGRAMIPSRRERKDGTALLNPDRSVSAGMGLDAGARHEYPQSKLSNDYREGKTFAYPPGRRRPGGTLGESRLKVRPSRKDQACPQTFIGG